MNKILIFLIVALNISFSQTSSVCDEIIKNVKGKYAPDKRVELFTINIKRENNRTIISGETTSKEAKEELLNTIKQRQINFVDSIKILPEENLSDYSAIVNVSVCNIRSKPNHRGEMATQALLGTIVRPLKKEDGFTLIQTPDKYIAWVDDSAIQLVNNNSAEEWINSKKVFYKTENGFCYSEKNKNSQRVSDLSAGNILKLKNEWKDYFEVEFPDKRTAFISKDEADLMNEYLKSLSISAKTILETSEKYIGLPYLWGGTSSKGMDCSGFTKTVYFLNGIVLPRDASQQVYVGELIKTHETLENLKPGDLLFFGRKKTEEKKERITHVGIYKGNLEFIHASGRVKINSFDSTKANFSEHHLNTLIRGRRMLNSIDTPGIISIKNHKSYYGDK